MRVYGGKSCGCLLLRQHAALRFDELNDKVAGAQNRCRQNAFSCVMDSHQLSFYNAAGGRRFFMAFGGGCRRFDAADADAAFDDAFAIDDKCRKVPA